MQRSLAALFAARCTPDRWASHDTSVGARCTPVPCGHSVITARRSELAGWAGYGYCPSHSRWYWGSKLLLICTCDGTVTGFGLANPKLFGEREQTRQMLTDQPAKPPGARHRGRHGQGPVREDTEAFFAGPDLALVRPARKDETTPRPFPTVKRSLVAYDH